MNTDTLKVNEVSQNTLLIRLNRPEAYNALNTEMLCALGQQLLLAGQSKSIQCVIITGDKKAFAAGSDVTELKGISTGQYPEEERLEAWQRIREFRKPLIAAINGFAFGGGCELAMHADILVASSTAQFAQPEVKLGLMPGAGGSQYLPTRVGKATAMLMNLTGIKLNAQRALEVGLISELVDSDDALPRALELAATIETMSQSALIANKASILQSYECGQTAALQNERAMFLEQAQTADGVEGISAFIEKRKPSFNA
ncbi:MAG: enoyl-CoA hydratase-related protein [Arenicella sp.]|nr:enoyl-CoA hydratase-related protein [Arenicella sp.]